MKLILDKFGVDTSTLPDNLYSTLLDAIYNVEVAQTVEFVEGADFTGTSSTPGLALAISKVTVPDGVTSIGYYAFGSCTSLASITIPESVTSIGNYAFRYCTSLASITIPDSVTSIGDYAFEYCSSLESVMIENGVTSIGNYAFHDCTSLASITIPNSVTKIGSCVFQNCTSLANIYYKGTQEQWNAITKNSSWNSNMGSNVSGGTKIHYNYTG